MSRTKLYIQVTRMAVSCYWTEPASLPGAAVWKPTRYSHPEVLVVAQFAKGVGMCRHRVDYAIATALQDAGISCAALSYVSSPKRRRKPKLNKGQMSLW